MGTLEQSEHNQYLLPTYHRANLNVISGEHCRSTHIVPALVRELQRGNSLPCLLYVFDRCSRQHLGRFSHGLNPIRVGVVELER